jgi:hypothetical protein
MQRLKERMLEHARYLFSIMLLHPDDLMSQLRVVNCETLELSDTPEQVGPACWCVNSLSCSMQAKTEGSHKDHSKKCRLGGSV